MKSQTITDEQREFVLKKVSLMRNRLYRHVCPIFDVNEKGELSQYGSSVLLKIDTKYFLITAAHVIAPSKRSIQYLWGASGEVPLKSMVQGSIHITSSSLDDHNDDKVDLAHVQLLDDAPTILNQFSFLNIRDIELTDLVSETKTYITIGYPLSLTKPRYKQPILDQRYLFHMSGIANESIYKELNVPYQAYLAVIYDRNKVVDSSGYYKKAPYPKGISGGGILAFPNKPPSDIESEIGKLVGIVLAYQAANNIILGIKIPVALEMIRLAHPELTVEIPKSDLLRVIVKNIKQ